MDYTIMGIILISLIVGYFFSKILKKINYELNGLELIIYQLAFALVFHIGKYFNFDYEQKYLGIVLFIIVGIYYFLRGIKTRKYIDAYIVLFIILSIILNYFSVQFVPFDHSKSVLVISGITLFSIIVIDFMIMFGVKTNLNGENNSKKNIPLLIVLIICSFFNIGYGYVGNFLLEEKSDDLVIVHLQKQYGSSKEYKVIKKECKQYSCKYTYETNNKYEYYTVSMNKDTHEIESEFHYCLTSRVCKNKAEDVAKDYLYQKYGDFDYKIDDSETDCYYGTCYIMFETKYTDEPFEVIVNKESYRVESDDFLILYFSKVLNEEIYSTYKLEQYIADNKKESLEDEFFSKYGIEITFGYSSFEEDLETMYFGKIPTLLELEEYASINITNIQINKEFTSTQINEFNDYLVTIFEDLKANNAVEDYDTLRFKFDYLNPFYNGTSYSYKYSGYIRDSGSVYLIYVQPTPYNVEKK